MARHSIIDEQNDDEQGESAALELAALQVTGGASATYPAFAADIHHYALTCHDATTLRVTAQASSSAVRLTLLRDDPAANHTSAGSLDMQVNVNRDHDIAIELGAVGGGTVTYVVHCLSSDFPDIVVLTKAEDVSEGLLFMAPRYRIAGGDWLFHMAIVDNNGVPRFHRALDRGAMDFRPVRHPIAVNGQVGHGSEPDQRVSSATRIRGLDGDGLRAGSGRALVDLLGHPSRLAGAGE